ncbi:hypothetical protein I3843_16G066100 [Carya illinoinensis]|uniref:DUF7880 domain-containing protein n=1 Tax=Carya illinoinensis TaxID=32201 RepID=A0A8T1N298_CARIL|nr:uncharacterized protein LOC122299531 [Carya illinoinensis]KAG2664185.1 hypothetical protein I3760_16G068000 [Carya illinoinensis]KAG6625046.1 hypothetical protein CIPAW_16G068300 [Carya illinoinensis]KAG6672571.1 hypothetical protein I3842_16G064500 [Carya illinoinensis]KAG7941821.1 hypothetical protein I3843_16G066100 [Carya illinoinensis]
MVMLATPSYVSAKPLTCPLSPIAKAQRKLPRVKCALSPPKWRENRRLISISFVLSHLFSIPNYAIAGSIFDKYVKRKKLDPLEVYVPAVILTQSQIKDLEKSLEAEQPQYAACRSLLRSGPAASLRVNIRAVAQYALDNGNGNSASDSVDQCLRALEELDSLLLRASRNDTEASVESMKGKINMALNALESLLQTVPSDVLQKGKAVADSYMITEDEREILDKEMQQLESIL